MVGVVDPLLLFPVFVAASASETGKVNTESATDDRFSASTVAEEVAVGSCCSPEEAGSVVVVNVVGGDCDTIVGFVDVLEAGLFGSVVDRKTPLSCFSSTIFSTTK